MQRIVPLNVCLSQDPHRLGYLYSLHFDLWLWAPGNRSPQSRLSFPFGVGQEGGMDTGTANTT